MSLDHIPFSTSRKNRKLGSEKSQTILLVDDDNSVREFVSLLLEGEGYTVLKARHSQEAFFFNAEFLGTIHLLLTDYSMGAYPNGYELAQKVRSARPNIKVLYVSGFADENVLRKDLEAGTALFLPKPFSPVALLESVRLVLGVAIDSES